MGMNVREGMRRLGILLGVCGGILGGFIAYSTAETLWNTGAAYRKFASLMASPAMHKVANDPFTPYGGFEVQSKKNKFGDIPVAESEDREIVSEGDGNGGVYLLQVHPRLKGNADGIAKVHFDASQRVASIELTTGEPVPRTEDPKLRAYFALLAYPVFGFLLPWGGIRVFTWVGSGFVAARQ